MFPSFSISIPCSPVFTLSLIIVIGALVLSSVVPDCFSSITTNAQTILRRDPFRSQSPKECYMNALQSVFMIWIKVKGSCYRNLDDARNIPRPYIVETAKQIGWNFSKWKFHFTPYCANVNALPRRVHRKSIFSADEFYLVNCVCSVNASNKISLE